VAVDRSRELKCFRFRLSLQRFVLHAAQSGNCD